MSLAFEKGSSSPFFRVFYDGQKWDEELTSMVSFFCVKFNEKNGASVEFIVESNNPDIPDEHPFQEHDKIEIEHGELGGKKSSLLTYYVREVHPTYSSKGISLRIRALDRASYMKEMATLAGNNSPLNSNNNESNKLARRADLLALLEQQYGMSVKVLGINLKNVGQVLDERDELRQAYKDWLFRKNWAAFNDQIPGSINPGMAAIARADVAKQTQEEVEALQKIIKYLKEPITPVAASTKKDYFVLRDAMRGAPLNPQITSSGDEVEIAPRNFNQPPFRVYKYKSDTSYLEFNPETKNRTQGASSTNINIVIPNREEKTFTEKEVGESTDENPRLAPGVNVPNPDERYSTLRLDRAGTIKGTGRFVGASRSGTANRGLTKTGVPLESGLSVFGFGSRSRVTTRMVDPKDPKKGVEDKVLLEGSRYDGVTSSYMKQDGIQIAARDQTAQSFSPVAILNAREYLEALYDAAEDGDTAYNDANNQRTESSIKMNPGSIKVAYDPELTNKKVIRVENSSKKFSGNYYVIDCEHWFSKNQPAYTQMSIARSGRGITGNENTNTVDVRDIGKNLNDLNQEQRDSKKALKIVNPQTSKE